MSGYKRMRRVTTSCVAAAFLLAAGCGGSETNRAGDLEALFSDIDVPTQEEANRRAAQEITEENADEVFEELLREIQEEDAS